jgi:hypothetical protein
VERPVLHNVVFKGLSGVRKICLMERFWNKIGRLRRHPIA